jgi:uncharacterized protein YyaL (SSP411 family)
MSSEPKYTNRLSQETSPYLKQHAHNPVDWYPWGDESLGRARAENKPILLSIGYSACHWCHVMERESFENPVIASLMNREFINIKVDREERPDLDQIYQNAVQMFLGRGGGWPLTMFLTPDGAPFFGGTYFPPEDRYSLPGFPRVLAAVAQAYRERPDDIAKTAHQILDGLQRISPGGPTEPTVPSDLVADAASALSRFFEPIHGGFGNAPKFPNPMAHSLLLRHHRATKDPESFRMVALTLRNMAEGGIYDQLGGGFHRYSVDERWLVPHFEKMLYDNALLTRLYFETHQVTGDAFYRGVAEEILEYALREMCHPDGGFYSTQDADSEGHEGKFFVWSYDEVQEIAGNNTGELFCRYYGVTREGNFEGRNILHVDRSMEAVAREFNRAPEETARIIHELRQKLFEARERRIKPNRDEKILTGWNGLMISALAIGHQVTGRPVYLEAARRAAEFIFKHLYRNGRLLRTYTEGRSKLNGYLDDYAFLIQGLLDLAEADSDPSLLTRGRELCGTLLDLFWDDAQGGCFFTGRDHETLIHRPMSGHDQAIPSGNAVTATVLLRLHYYTEDRHYLDLAERLLKRYAPPMRENPFGYAAMLAAADLFHHPPKQVVIVGPMGHPETEALLRKIHGVYLPNRCLWRVDPDRPNPVGIPPFAAGKNQVEGRPTAYVCERMVCSAPVTTWEALASLLL